MAPRTRFQSIPTPKGRVVTNGVLAAGGNYTVEGAHHSCSDQTGPGDCDPLSIYHLTMEGGRVNVVNDPNNYWDNYRVDFMDTMGTAHLSAGLGQDFPDAHYATAIAARTNPSRPYVDIPVNILELADIAQLIRRQGLTTLAGIGRQNLRYQFGIAPLVSDLVKMSEFQDQVQRRIRSMEALQGAGGLRRTMALGSWSSNASYSRVMQSNQFFWTDTVYQTTTQNIRGHIRWLPDIDFGGLSTSERERLAFRSALGLTFDRSTVWEAIPWTWLIDWCSNVGQYFTATRNIIPAVLSGVHIMRETRSEFRTNGGINTPIRVTRIDRTRNPSFITPVAHFPFLDGRQLGILASLAVTRR